MAVQATLLEIPFDPRTLYDAEDRGYLVWFAGVVNRVADIRRRQNDQMRRGK